MKKAVPLLAGSLVLLAATAILMLGLGAAGLSFSVVAAVLLSKIGVTGGEFTAAQETIIWHIRWQRVALAILVGGGLAVSGTCFQAMFKNPLADPFVLGVSSGAALGAAIAIVLGQSGWIMFFAFGGALLSLALVHCFGGQRLYLRSDQQLLLAGIACGALLNALLSTVMALHSEQMSTIMFWLMGSLTNYVETLRPVAAVVAVGLAVAFLFSRDLDALTLGDETASCLGVEVARVKLTLLVTATLVTGVCVAVSGVIGFVGLVVPHMVRRALSVQHCLLLPLSAVWGAIFLLLADGLLRAAPQFAGIPVGVITALVGSPFFLYILHSSGRRP